MPTEVQYVLAGTGLLLVVATSAIAIKHVLRPGAGDHVLWLRIRSWWVMATLFSLALFNTQLSILLFVAVSWLALREYLSIIPTRAADRYLHWVMYSAIPLQYWWVWQGWYGAFASFIPVLMFLCVPLCMLFTRQTQGFLGASARLQWGLMGTVFALSHAVYLLNLPASGYPLAGPLLYLVLLTQLNDVLQFVWGTLLGKTKVVPSFSVSKTWAGLVGGVAGTLLLAWVLAPYLTPFTGWQALQAGLLIGLGGFVGDVVMSAVKRDLGRKDSGTLIPGHGGILDRVDSLIYTAPLFFYWFRLQYA